MENQDIYNLKLEKLREALREGIEQAKNGEGTEFSLKEIISELNQESAS
jgi:hypothetical protein